MRTISNTLFTLVAIALITSCNSKRKPNYQYFPNMYESVAYEAYSSHEVFGENHTSEALTPPEGTVKRGWLPYDFQNSAEGYANAKANLVSPLPYTKENEAKGMELYTIYCAICHGDKGDGKGTLVQREKILGVPAYNDPGRNVTQGSIYHVMYYGINSMGSYAAQTSIEDRWQIVQYVEALKNKLDGKTPRIVEASDITKTNAEYLFGSPGVVETTKVDSLGVDTKHVGHGHKGEAGHEVSNAKLNLLGGKSHHSHKEADKNN